MNPVKAWRLALGLTQVEAAKALGISRRALAYYEAGREAPEPVKRLANCLMREFQARCNAQEGP